jgi:hypothetical protein
LVVLEGGVQVLKILGPARLVVLIAAFWAASGEQADSHTKNYIPPAAHLISVASTQDFIESSIGLEVQQQSKGWLFASGNIPSL